MLIISASSKNANSRMSHCSSLTSPITAAHSPCGTLVGLCFSLLTSLIFFWLLLHCSPNQTRFRTCGHKLTWWQILGSHMKDDSGPIAIFSPFNIQFSQLSIAGHWRWGANSSQRYRKVSSRIWQWTNFDTKISYYRRTAWRAISVDMLSTTAQLYEKSNLNRLPIGRWR